MIIKTSFETLETAMVTVSNIVSDKNLQEDLKNVVIWVKDGKTRLAAYNGNIVSATGIEATVQFPSEDQPETLFQLKAKDINDVVTSFKGLKRTKVSEVELHIKENEAVMHIHEVPIDDTLANASEYNQESKFRITKPRLKDVVKAEIQKINMELESGSQVNSVDLLVYINALLPTVAKETRESTNNVMFGDDHVYAVLAPYSAIMPNKLPDVLKGFRLQNSVVSFLKNFISDAQTFVIEKADMGNGMVVLTVKVNDSVAMIKCADMSRAFDITNFISVPANGIVVDKAYLIDVLKRMSLSAEAAFVEIVIAEGKGTMKVVSKNMTQNIPVINAKGDGLFPFSIRAELLSNVVFSHSSVFGENVFFYLEHTERGNIVLACTDNTQMWQTKMTGLTPSKGDFAWS
jgi:hypothetical protein